jgi:hypothetical protein
MLQSCMRRSLLIVIALVGCASRGDSDSFSRIEQPFKATGSLISVRNSFGIALLTSGEVMVVAGLTTGGGTQHNEHWDPASGAWSAKKVLSTERGFVTATTVASGKVVVIGGSSDSGEAYDPTINEWSAIAADGPYRVHHATLLTTGKILIVGHNGTTWMQPRLYDAAANTWSAAGTMTAPREDHVAHVLYDGRVLVAGGYNGSYLSTVELYAPATNSWSVGSALMAQRAHATSAVLPGKRILIAGGYNGSALSSAEIYDPITKTSEATSSMSKLRTAAAAVALSSGRVLVIGGDNGVDMPEASTEVYDPTTKKWSSGPTMATPRYAFGVMPVSGGRILVVGGKSGPSSLSTAEVFGGLALDAGCVIDEECTSGSCTMSKCAAPPVVDAGIDAPDTAVIDSAIADSASPVVDTDPADAAAPPKPSEDDSGCGCRTPARRGESHEAVLLLCAAALLIRRRDNGSSGERRSAR